MASKRIACGTDRLFIVTNMSRPAERVLAFYNKRGTCEQWIKEGKGAIKWTRLSCQTFAANAVRLQLHALAYNLANFLRTLATPEPMSDWSLTTLKEKLIKIGAKVVSHGRYIVFQMAEVAIPRQMFQEILRLIAAVQKIAKICPPPSSSGKSRFNVTSSVQCYLSRTTYVRAPMNSLAKEILLIIKIFKFWDSEFLKGGLYVQERNRSIQSDQSALGLGSRSQL
jgi:Transposase DDE domain group 1